ncbi:hypothetical protein MKX08_001089 [Trichoderma sp. CBMAI-0020]|nr:hypothetical protein MKX08_001089 [Trichoderma sp. CBMAI-0020]
MTASRKRRSSTSPQPNHTKRTRKITQFHHYEPLDPLQQQIRLLELLPGKPGSRISIKLHTVSLSDNPEYEALSYCWGPPKPSYDIFIHVTNNNYNNNNNNNNPDQLASFPVGRNLRKALDDLRLPSRPRLVWNDAICINQKDNVEKGHQIQLMHQIYSRAAVVCAWLDHNVRPKTSVFDDLESLGKGVELDDFHDPAYWYPVADIFRNEYWRRLWVQQELILAAKVDVYCRRDVFSGEQLLEFQQKVNVVKSQRTRLGGPEFVLSRYIDGNTSADPTPEIFGGGVIQARINMREGRQAQEAYSLSLASSSASSVPPPPSGTQSPSPAQGFTITRGLLASSLLNLFLQSSSVRMTDPRDRLYGILGLATDIAQDSSLEVTYEVSPFWVYAQVFRHFIHRYKSLSFLCFNKSNPRGSYTPRKGFPSWMPHADVCWSYVNASRACGSMLATPFSVFIDLETLCLRAQGIKVDAIKHICLINGDGRGWTPIPEWLNEIESFCRKTWPDADDSTPLYERGNVTSLMFPCLSPKRYKNMWKLDKPDPQRRIHLIRSLLAAVQKADQKDLSTGDIIRGGYTPTDIIPADVREECHPLHVESNAVVLFGTEGSRVGSMARTSDIRAGDEIWILFGCRMPLMMRPKREEGKELRYQVIGPAIVPGLMKGEVINADHHGTTVILE